MSELLIGTEESSRAAHRSRPVVTEKDPGESRQREPGTLVYWLLLVTSLLVIALAAYQYAQQRGAMSEAQANLDECEQVVEEIARLQKRPRLATSNLGSSQDTSQRIAAAIEAAGIPSKSLQSMSPSPEARLGVSDYRERTTRLDFRGVALAKLHAFESQLRKGSGLTVSELTISVPNRADLREVGGASKELEFWNAQLTLTELIYSPTSPR
ncbi:MAG: hypothetical protein ACE361_23260 [Aureliella sp.]